MANASEHIKGKRLALLKHRAEAKKRKPSFRTQDAHKKLRLKDRWRRARGIQSKVRLKKRGYARKIAQGYRSPAAVRGLSRDGLRQVVVSAVSQIKELNHQADGIIIARSVGLKKRLALIEEAKKAKFTILNIADAPNFVAAAEELLKKRKEHRKERAKKQEAKKKAKEPKREEKLEGKLKKEEEAKPEDAEKKEKDRLLTKREEQFKW
ncbi:TPA: hypothetical protein HA361_05385 [Candidatus Woesearchaeota archaeon]|nr:hypothetical protein [Candidatus Woesearchaeota archaeon]HII68291.1 hypothetical protein [Candidatus Woesearchaeota archaeon]